MHLLVAQCGETQIKKKKKQHMTTKQISTKESVLECSYVLITKKTHHMLKSNLLINWVS